MNRGFSIIELMVAMGILIIVLSAVAITSFGDQSFLIGSQTNAEAMIKAQEMLEAQQALARKDFNLVNATSTNDGFYTSAVQITNAPGVSPHPFDYLTKAVKAVISWKDERGTTRNLTLNTLISNFTGAAGGSTCNSSLEGNWTAPSTHSYSLAALAGVSGSYPVTALDAYQDKLYIAAGPTAASTDKKFFIFNLVSGVPSYVSGSALNTSGTTKPAQAIVIAATSTNGKTYAFLANGVAPDWSSPSTCGIASASCSQLEVVDVTTPSALTIVAYFKFATSTYSTPNALPYVSGSSGQASGKSVYYKNGYLFLGLTKTGSGPEFHIIDVHNPLFPQSVGSYTVGRTVNAIYVKGSFAYLATDDNAAGNNNVLTILDLSDPTSPKKVWPNLISSSLGVGSVVTTVGDTLYFATTYNNPAPPEFFIFNNPSPSTKAPTQTGGVSLGGTLSVSAMLIRDYLAYLLTSSNSLQILYAGTGAQYAPPIALSGSGSAMDCEGNYLYVGSSDSGGGITEVTGS